MSSQDTDAPVYPQGAIQGLCSSGATCFALCIAVLGAWGFHNETAAWEIRHLLVLIPLISGATGFALTPYLATRPVISPEKSARRIYFWSVALTVIAITAAIVLAWP